MIAIRKRQDAAMLSAHALARMHNLAALVASRVGAQPRASTLASVKGRQPRQEEVAKHRDALRIP